MCHRMSSSALVAPDNDCPTDRKNSSTGAPARTDFPTGSGDTGVEPLVAAALAGALERVVETATNPATFEASTDADSAAAARGTAATERCGSGTLVGDRCCDGASEVNGNTNPTTPWSNQEPGNACRIANFTASDSVYKWLPVAVLYSRFSGTVPGSEW